MTTANFVDFQNVWLAYNDELLAQNHFAVEDINLQVKQGEFIAIDHALGQLNPGDLCLILIDQVEEALAHIGQRVAEQVLLVI